MQNYIQNIAKHQKITKIQKPQKSKIYQNHVKNHNTTTNTNNNNNILILIIIIIIISKNIKTYIKTHIARHIAKLY